MREQIYFEVISKLGKTIRTTITVVYDKVGNTLDVWLGKPRKAICEEIGKGFILKKDLKGNVLGFEKLNYVGENHA